MKTFVLNLILLVSSTVLLNAQSITFQLPDIPNPEDTVAVPLSVVQCNLNCCEHNSMQFEIEYNPDVLTPFSVYYPNPNMPYYEWVDILFFEDNKIMLTWLSFQGVIPFQPPAVLCEINFLYLGGYSDLTLTEHFSNGCYYNADNGSVGYEESDYIIFEIPSVPDPGSNVIVPLNVLQCDPGCADIFITQFWLHFDPTVLNFEGIVPTNPNFPFYEWSSAFINMGTWMISWLSFSGGYTVQPPEEICGLEFTYLGGSTPLILNAVNTDTTSSCEWISLSGCIGSTCQNQNWIGSINEDWFEPGNWYSGNIPNSTDNVIIQNANFYPKIDMGSVEVDNIVISDITELSVIGQGSLTVLGFIYNNGSLIIKTDKIGRRGSFIDNGISNSGYGDVTYKIRLDNPNSANNIYSWHNISSPMNGFTTDQILDYEVKLWDENENEWTVAALGDSCNPVLSSYLYNMEGWSIRLNPNIPDTCPEAKTGTIIEFEGSLSNLHHGSYSIPFTANTSGYNLLGNPYPSYVDPALINWPANLNQAIYFQSAWAESYWSWVGGIGPNIPPAQGFFVKATGDGTLTFTGNERVHDSISTNELPAGEKLLCLKVISQQNQLFDLTYIRFKDKSTAGFDQQWDAYKMFTESEHSPQLYTKALEEALSINSIPEASTVPIYFTSGQSGDFTIKASEVKNFDEVYLEDILTGETTDLLDREYPFNYDPGENPGRFMVHFNSVGIRKINTNQINIWSQDGKLIIQSPELLKGEITVYNLLGQKIHSEKIQSIYKEIFFDNPNSVYIVKIVTNESSFCETIFIK